MISLSTDLMIGEHVPAELAISRAAEAFEGSIVMSTSFGIQSAVLLHMVTRLIPDIPVVWIDTGYLPAETYHYADTLAERYDLNLHIYRGQMSPAHMEARYGRLWETGNPEDLDRYHWIRKLEPMKRALRALGAEAWLAGIRKSQTTHRRELSKVTSQWDVVKVHPILAWSDEDIDRYMRSNDLPKHPLVDKGFVSVGDVQLSSPEPEAKGRSYRNGRAGRFNGLREECGLHVPHNAAVIPKIEVARFDRV